MGEEFFCLFSSLAAGEEIKSRNQIGLVVITIQRMTLDFSVHQVRTAEWIKLQKCSVD